MGNFAIYSIGHGGRSIGELISLLKDNEISYVIDVRTKPRSRFHPQYNKERLDNHLKSENIRYVFMGENLGGLPKDESCYDTDGHVNYEKTKQQAFFKEGIARIKTAYEKKIRIACMCSEIDPCDCHRSKLIGEALKDIDIPMIHIGKHGELEDQRSVINRAISNSSSHDLFSNEKAPLRSRKPYR